MTNSETTISAAQVTMDENDLGMTVPNRKLCDQVRDRIHDFEGRPRKEIVELGALLIQVKGTVGHGAFKKWLDAEVRWTIRTAENYMNVAKNIGDKYETVSQLPLATVYALAGPAVSDQVRQKVFATIADPANPPSDEIKKLLGETRGKAKAAAKKGNVTSVEVRGTTSLKGNPRTSKAGVLKIDEPVVNEHLVSLAKSWLIRITELAPEICAKIKEYGAYDVGVAIGVAAEAIRPTKKATKVAALEPEPVTPKPTKSPELTLSETECSGAGRSYELDDDDDFDRQINAQFKPKAA